MKEMIAKAYADHKVRRLTGWTWQASRPGSGRYLFRVTWCPYNLIVTGDAGDIIVTHYSFDDPWSAAAWINGANFDYFMGKTNRQKEYSPEATSKFIVEQAYERLLRERDDLRLFEAICDHVGSWYDPTKAHDRKEACRELMSSELSQADAYEITNDGEDIIYCYPENARWQYEALRIWAKWVWDNEPAWHRVVRCTRRVKGEIEHLRRYPVHFGPVIYKSIDESGRHCDINGGKYWLWTGKSYRSIHPLRLFGRTWDHIGLWREGGTGWSDPVETALNGRRPDDRFSFVDVRAA